MELHPFAFLAIAAPAVGGVLCAALSFALARLDDGTVPRLAKALDESFRVRPLAWRGAVDVVFAPASPLVVRLRREGDVRAPPVVVMRLTSTCFVAELSPPRGQPRVLERTPEAFDAAHARAFVDEMAARAATLAADVGLHAVGTDGHPVAVPV